MEDYSMAIFEDGTTEMIPKSWVQDYLSKNEATSSNDSDLEEELKHKFKSRKLDDNNCDDLSNQNNKIEDNSKVTLNEVSQTVSENKNKIEKLQNTMDQAIKTLNSINSKAEENKLTLSRLQKSVDRLICIAVGEPEPEVNLSEPTDTIDDFLKIEDYIKIKENYNEMVQYLSKIGGKTVESCTRKIWKRLCTTSLATKICWTGVNGKLCLKNLAINNVVRDATLVSHPNGKESEIQRATMLWFSHAQDRLRGRKTTIIGFKNAF